MRVSFIKSSKRVYTRPTQKYARLPNNHVFPSIWYPKSIFPMLPKVHFTTYWHQIVDCFAQTWSDGTQKKNKKNTQHYSSITPVSSNECFLFLCPVRPDHVIFQICFSCHPTLVCPSTTPRTCHPSPRTYEPSWHDYHLKFVVSIDLHPRRRNQLYWRWPCRWNGTRKNHTIPLVNFSWRPPLKWPIQWDEECGTRRQWWKERGYRSQQCVFHQGFGYRKWERRIK